MKSKYLGDIKGSIITFYSYKGGTGRSMALANVACLLNRRIRGNHGVLVIDWDLEAPGLDKYFNKVLPHTQRQDWGPEDVRARQPGLMDLMLELDSLSRDVKDPDPGIFKKIDLKRYLLRTTLGGLSLMTAGQFDSKYASRVGTFNWESLYKRAPWLIPAFADYLSDYFEYVLIDSRTGLTDTSGICTMLMPEKLVVVFTPNRQSLLGGIDVVRRATQYRKQSNDLRPLTVFPLPSRIEPAEPDLRESWRYGDPTKGIHGYQPLFEQLYQECYDLPSCNLQNYFDEIQIQHVPRYAYGEEIALLTERSTDRLSLTRSYESFANRVTAPTGPWEDAALFDHDAYACYDQQDREEVEPILAMAEQDGLKIWRDAEQMRPQEEWRDALKKAQDQAKAFVVFIGRRGLSHRQSWEIERIVLLARERRLPLIPILLKGVGALPEAAKDLSIWSALSLDHDGESAGQVMARSLKGLPKRIRAQIRKK
jgi:hypothetical protein